MDFDITVVQKLVGLITYEQMSDVDAFVSNNVALFIPSTGPCKYSITEDHSHPGYSFIFNFDNYCHVVVDGKEIDSQAGTISAFSPEVKHHEVLTDLFTRYIAIMIDRQYFEKNLKNYSIQEIPIFKADRFHPAKELSFYLKDFMIEYQNRLPGYQDVLKAMGLKITHSIIRMIFQQPSAKSEIASRMDINQSIEYMHTHYSEKIVIDDLADEVALSPSHFSRVFKGETGNSPMDYLIKIRLDKAKLMLFNDSRNMTDIALECGFNSSSHFTSTFKKHFKVSPSEYRKSL